MLFAIIIAVVILLGSLGKVYFSGGTETEIVMRNGTLVETGEAGGRGSGAFWATMFHPKVLGVIFVLLIAVFATITLTKSVKLP